MKKQFTIICILGTLLSSCGETVPEGYEENPPVNKTEKPKEEPRPCTVGQMRPVLDSKMFKNKLLGSNDTSTTNLYLLPEGDSVTVVASNCEFPRYRYTYSTNRYKASIKDVNFYYDAVNKFYLLVEKGHYEFTYKFKGLRDQARYYIEVEQNAVLNNPMGFDSDNVLWVYTLEELKEAGDRRIIIWTVRKAEVKK